MDAIDMLMKDHAGAKKALEAILAMPGGEKKKKSFEALKKELELHDHIEETIFYPTVKAHPRAGDFGGQDKAAHEVVEEALAQLAEMPNDSPEWNKAFASMQESLLRHVRDEESNIFVKIKAALSPAELKDLGKRMQVEKEHMEAAA